MSDELDDMLKRSRLVYRATQGGGEGPGVPPGFAERVVRNKRSKPSATVVIWERAGFVGAIASVGIAAFVHLQVAGRDSEEAARAWMEMDNSGEGEVVPQ